MFVRHYFKAVSGAGFYVKQTPFFYGTFKISQRYLRGEAYKPCVPFFMRRVWLVSRAGSEKAVAVLRLRLAGLGFSVGGRPVSMWPQAYNGGAMCS